MNAIDTGARLLDAQPAAFDAGCSSAQAHIAQMVMAIWPARAIYAAAQLAIPDHLAAGPLPVVELAQLTKTHAHSLKRLLRALGSCGIVSEISPNCFSLTALGSALQTDAPGSVRALVLTIGGDWQWNAWAHILDSLKTGESGLSKSTGLELFSYLEANPDEQARFNAAMTGIHGAEFAAVANAYDFSAFRTILDIGGGTGLLISEILKTTARTRGTVLELPATANEARKAAVGRGLGARYGVAGGDFFQAIPQGYDGYILSHVLHDWTDELALKILQNCRRAIPRHGRLLIVEAVLPEGDVPHHGKLMDLLMLTVTGGIERTRQEFSTLLAAAEFSFVRIIATKTHQSIIEAIPNNA
jgi:SAM-dependent methyltransferase